MLRKLEGKTPYDMVNNATGDLAAKLQRLAAKYAEDARVFELCNQFVGWWYLPFDDDKDRAGRQLWDEAERLMETLDAEYGCAAATTTATTDVTTNTTTESMTTLERAGNAVGKVLGKSAGVTTNVTIASAVATHAWMRDAAIPATRAGGREFWKGLKATARAARDSYRDSRARRHDKDDDLPY